LSAGAPEAVTPLSALQRDELAVLLGQQLEQRQRQRATRQGQASSVDYAINERQQDSDEPEQRDGDREVNDALSARDAQEEQALAAALARLAQGVYGICVRCAEPISIDRLRAQPEASRCAGCEARMEALQGMPGPP